MFLFWVKDNFTNLSHYDLVHWIPHIWKIIDFISDILFHLFSDVNLPWKDQYTATFYVLHYVVEVFIINSIIRVNKNEHICVYLPLLNKSSYPCIHVAVRDPANQSLGKRIRYDLIYITISPHVSAFNIEMVDNIVFLKHKNVLTLLHCCC